MHFLIGAALVIAALGLGLVGLIPSGIYGWAWWAIPKEFWPVFFTTTFGGVFWIGIQMMAVMSAGYWYGALKGAVNED